MDVLLPPPRGPREDSARGTFAPWVRPEVSAAGPPAASAAGPPAAGPSTTSPQSHRVLIAVLVVVLIIAIVWLCWARLSEKDDRKADVGQLRQLSGGGFDDAAAEALQTAEARPARHWTPGDHYHVARLYDLNIGANPAVGRAGRVLARARAAGHYLEAAAGRGRRNFVIGGGLDDDFDLDDAIIGAIFGLFERDDDIPFPAAFGLLGAAEATREASLRERRAEAGAAAAAAGGGAGAVAAEFYARSISHTSDPQNVHDVSVNAANRAILGRLRDDQGPVDRLPALNSVALDLAEEGPGYSVDPATRQPRPELVEKALAVVQAAARGEFYDAIGGTDEEVIRRAWARSDDARNAGNRTALRQAVFDQLVAAWAPGLGHESIVCVGGRTADALGAFALLDFDPQNWEVNTLEALRNEVIAAADAEVKAAAREAAGGQDAALRVVGLGYLAKTQAELAAAGTPEPGAASGFAAGLRQRLSALVDAEVARANASAPGSIPPLAAADLKTTVLAAIDE